MALLFSSLEVKNEVFYFSISLSAFDIVSVVDSIVVISHCLTCNSPMYIILMQLCCRNQYSRSQVPHSESWRTQIYYAGGPSGVNTPSSEPQTKGLRSFYTRTGMIKQVRRFPGPGRLQRAGQG